MSKYELSEFTRIIQFLQHKLFHLKNINETPNAKPGSLKH